MAKLTPGLRLRLKRVRARLTLREVAAEAGYSRELIALVERDQYPHVTHRHLEAIDTGMDRAAEKKAAAAPPPIPLRKTHAEVC